MLLSPNEFHAPQVEELADLGTAVFVEKPLATTLEGLRSIEASLQRNPRLYCSDYYSDVRAVPLRTWLGSAPEWSNDTVEISGDLDLWKRGLAAIGPVRTVEAVIHEGAGEAADWPKRRP
jgi:GFO/IDH/MocA oxidoreductase family protein